MANRDSYKLPLLGKHASGPKLNRGFNDFKFQRLEVYLVKVRIIIIINLGTMNGGTQKDSDLLIYADRFIHKIF